MIRIHLDQSSPEWLEFRKGKLSASKCPIILNLSEYCTPLQLYEEEMGLREPQAQSPHMQRGLEIEYIAREWFYSTTGIQVKPAVVQSLKNPIFIASIDGISDDDKTIIEIKNNRKELHNMVRGGNIPLAHQAQMQHQMFVTGLNECHYVSHNNGDFQYIILSRNNLFIEEMVAQELEFLERLKSFNPPDPTDRDYEDVSEDTQLYGWVKRYKMACDAIKQAEQEAEYYKSLIKERSGDKNMKGSGWKFTKYLTQGRVDYDRLYEEYKIDPKSVVRKPGTISYRITVS